MRPARPTAVVAGGLATAIAVALAVGLPASDAVQLLGLSFGAALLTALVGHALLVGRREAPVGRQAAYAALVSVLGTAVGALAAGQAMFVSSHDLRAMLVVLIASATAGVLAALRLGVRVDAASRTLGELARGIGGDGRPAVIDATGAPAELARLADELEEMRFRLDAAWERERALERSRRELVAWVSHDLRTPLAGIRAMVEALADGVVDDPATVERYLLTMQVDADRLARLVDDLFELSRVHADAVELVREPVALGDVVSDVVASLAPLAEQKGVRLAGRVVDPVPSFEGGTAELGRVVTNLLENGVRHTPAGRSVHVEVRGEDGHAVVSVADGCGGIPDGELGRVFDVAFRGDRARSPDGDGNGGGGLGLAIARGLVEAHAGTITVDNTGDGCRFTVRLPADGQRSSAAMSRVARTVPRTVPVTFERPARAE